MNNISRLYTILSGLTNMTISSTAHLKDKTIHVSSDEKSQWNNKLSSFNYFGENISVSGLVELSSIVNNSSSGIISSNTNLVTAGAVAKKLNELSSSLNYSADKNISILDNSISLNDTLTGLTSISVNGNLSGANFITSDGLHKLSEKADFSELINYALSSDISGIIETVNENKDIWTAKQNEINLSSKLDYSLLSGDIPNSIKSGSNITVTDGQVDLNTELTGLTSIIESGFFETSALIKDKNSVDHIVYTKIDNKSISLKSDDDFGSSSFSGTDYEWNLFNVNVGTGISTSGFAAIAIGRNAKALNHYAFAQGYNVTASGTQSHAEGGMTNAYGDVSHAEGAYSIASKYASHAEGLYSITYGNVSHTEGLSSITYGEASHAEGKETIAYGPESHAEGNATSGIGYYSHAEGFQTISYSNVSHAEGSYSIASGYASHAEGNNTVTNSLGSHAEGFKSITSGEYSHAEGKETIAYGPESHAEGSATSGIGYYSHAEGFQTISYSNVSHAEGANSIASGFASHAEGYNTATNSYASHAEGIGGETLGGVDAQHVEGRWPVSGSSIGIYQHVVGNGTNTNDRKNIQTLDWNGNEWNLGNLSGVDFFTNDGLHKLSDKANKQFVEDRISAIINEAPEALDTLKEIADLLSGDTDGELAGTIIHEINLKADKTDLDEYKKYSEISGKLEDVANTSSDIVSGSTKFITANAIYEDFGDLSELLNQIDEGTIDLSGEQNLINGISINGELIPIDSTSKIANISLTHDTISGFTPSKQFVKPTTDSYASTLGCEFNLSYDVFKANCNSLDTLTVVKSTGTFDENCIYTFEQFVTVENTVSTISFNQIIPIGDNWPDELVSGTTYVLVRRIYNNNEYISFAYSF